MSTPPKRPHVYDGIEEFDNRLPNWWLWTLYTAIIFSVIYWFSWYQTSSATTDAERVTAAMQKIEEARLASVGEIDNDTLWQMANNPGILAKGQEVFVAQCQTCHLANLKGQTEGGIGVDLSDQEWRWGNQPLSLYEVVSNGSPDKSAGMQAWAAQLGPQKVTQVVAYVLSHHSPEEMAAATTLNEPIGLKK